MSAWYSGGREVDPVVDQLFKLFSHIFEMEVRSIFSHVLTAQTDSFSEYQHDHGNPAHLSRGGRLLHVPYLVPMLEQ